MKLLQMNHVKKSFNDETLHVLKDISLSVEKGEVVAIIGPSGSGKSTLLRCATLLTEMDSGELIYGDIQAVHNDADGKAVYADKGELKKVREKFGLVFQSFNLFPHYSVLKISWIPRYACWAAIRARRSSAPASFWKRWACPTRRTPIPVSFPADSSSAWPSPGHWRWIPRYSF